MADAQASVSAAPAPSAPPPTTPPAAQPPASPTDKARAVLADARVKREAPKADAPKTEVEAKTETPAANAPNPDAAKPAEDAKLTPRFAALANREREVVKKEQVWKQKEAELRRQADQLAAQQAEIRRQAEQLESLKKTDPLKALEMLGHNYDALTQAYLAGKKVPDPTPEQKAAEAARAEIEKYEKERKLAEQNAAEVERQKLAEAAKQAEVQVRQEIKEFVSKDAEKYELIGLNDASETVYEVMAQEYQKTGKLLSYAEAADLVENFLVESVRVNSKAKKLQAKAPPQPQEDPKPSTKAPQRKTLSNQLTATLTPDSPVKSDEERRARAVALLQAARASRA